jgi:hypothetical protein
MDTLEKWRRHIQDLEDTLGVVENASMAVPVDDIKDMIRRVDEAEAEAVNRTRLGGF